MAIYGHKMVPAKTTQQVFIIILLRVLTLAIAEEDLQNGRAVERVFFSVDEGQPPGTYVGTVPVRPGFTYSFSTDPPLFIINPNDGTIETTFNIDREELDEDVLNYVVLGASVTGALPTYPIEVRITIVDINDNSPSFPEPSISISFSESARVGSQYILDTATDPDAGTNGITENYAIAGGNPDNLFRLVVTPNPSGAAAFLHVETVGSLDREIQDFYQLNITAQDGGSPPLLGYILVNITIRDANDNPPIFDQSEYDVSLNESTPADTLVLRVRATDRDDGENADIIYFLDEGEDLFTIHPQTGEIRTLRTLDFENNGVYTITVEAQDKGNPTQYGRAFVHISLVDENDHSPTVTFRFIPSSSTFATVDEDAPIGTIAAIATVTDADEGLFGQAYLRIEAGNEQGHFRLYPLAGLYAVQVAAKLDRERISQYNLTFIGQDFGSPPRTTVAHMIIYVTDANDHDPVFSEEVYRASLSELSPVGSFVKSLTATDADSGLNAQVKYLITDGNDLDWFEIDENTGLVTTKAKLDQEFISEITLNVTAHDLGISQRQAQTHLVITVVDENDQAPAFTFTSYNVTIPENAAPNREITIVSASDTDLGVNGAVFYKLEEDVSVDYPGVFSIDSHSGKIVTLISFDRETISYYSITVRAFDGGSPPQFSTAKVNVRVTDLNDNHPEFYPINYYAHVEENEPAGTSVTQVSASDPDFGNNGAIEYSIVQDPSNGKFVVDRTTGVVRTTVSLDREEQFSYQLTVRARDGGNLISTTDAVVHITVRDIQDSPPQFTQTGYQFEIFENTDLGHHVGSVMATTRDASTTITYAISSGDRNGVFQIIAATGEIKTAKQIDREEQSFYQLTVIANGGPVIGQTTVNVTILDLNDNAPQFLRDAVITDVVESWEVGHDVYKVVAIDSDEGPNADIVYELITNPGNVFRIDSQTGQMSLNMPISGQSRTYFLQVLATDTGTPHRSSVLNVTVQVRDVNDHAPVFVQSSYATEVRESMELNAQFYEVSATDDDVGENGLVSYSVTHGSGASKFGIFPDGSLYLKNYLDRELMDHYVLTVTASDNGVPQRSSSVEVTITVLDDNDNRPLFANQTYYLYLQEEMPQNTYVGIIIASDQDTGKNAELSYSLSSGQSDYTINSLTGEISSTRAFDREELLREGKSTVFELDAVVRDNGEPRLEDHARIYIHITDINDNYPRFFSDVYTASISETAAINTPVVHVAAHDEDSGTNSEITYSITDGNADEKFQINTFTGQVTLMGMLDRETVAEYTLTVAAQDKGSPQPLTSFVQVQIHIIDENDNAPVFAQSARSVDVAETLEIGELITVVSASDEDTGQNALINYVITGGNVLNTFRIDQDSGNLYLAKPLDYETQNYYELNITAQDNGRTPLTDTIWFKIYVRDTNDNAPVFRSNAIIHQETEGVAVGTKLVTVTATDPDSGVNGEIVYSIAEQIPPGDHFSIDPKTGEIFTAAEIDREYLPDGTFQIIVMATDQAVPASSRKSTTKRVLITVADVNDNAPMFVSHNAASISESARVGDVVTTVTATDPDEGSNGEVTYSLSQNANGLFDINSYTGIIFLTQNLDASRVKYPITVTATDSGNSRKSSSFTITVIVVDSGNSGAAFTKSMYTGSVYENEPVGTNVVAVNARYSNGQNAQIEYYITSITSGNTDRGRDFVIDKSSGQLTVGRELDREEGYVDYMVTVYAIDVGASSPKTRSTQVQVTLLDRNDNAPRFQDSSKRVTISEDIDVNSLVTQVTANDPDEGTNAQVSYRIVSGNNDGKFYINEQSGEIRTLGELDRETVPDYTLGIRASDGTQSSIMSLDIRLLDTNDSPPAFTKEVYSFTVSEDEDVGNSVAEVTAIDPDEGSNGDVTYSIVEDWGQDRFSLDSDTGVFTLDKPLDFEEVQIYLIVVEAKDGGTVPMSSTVTCYFNTLDVNDNAPIFEPDTYKANIMEDLTIGTEVVVVTATDADAGLNGAIVYNITAGDENGDFAVREDGAIISVRELDREEKQLYALEVTATDQPSDPSLQMTAVAQVNIILTDVNDNAPEFHNNNATSVVENANTGTLVILVSAEDKDSGTNGQLKYSMDPVPGDVFYLYEDDGDLVVYGDLDRETTSEYLVKVYAEDSGTPALTSTMKILITILDENDNPPSFDPSTYTIGIMENIPVGKEFLQVTATDVDEGTNADVEFSITNGNYDNDFSIDKVSGVVATMNLLDREKREQYSLIVMAKDKGTPVKSSTTTVTINLQDFNDNIPEFETRYMTAVVDENNANVPVFVATCDAVDGDDGNNGKITYSISIVREEPILPIYASGIEDLFTIDKDTGDVYVTQALDREDVDRYYLLLTANDGGNPSLTGTGTLEVQVGDLNDNSPVFSQNTYAATVQEELDAGANVTMVTATDEDMGTNADVRYKLDTDSAENKFGINYLTGQIKTTVKLDREEKELYTLVVIAMDKEENDPDVRSSTSTVSVVVTDINDEAPAFVGTPYTSRMPDSSQAETYVFEVKTEDSDTGSNALIHYSIVGGNGMSKFSIGQLNGVVQTAIDLTSQASDYWIEVKAEDQGDGRHSVKTNITVEFLVATQFPSFSAGDPSLTLSEDSSVGTTVTTISATSPKQGSAGIISYYVAGGNFLNSFSVHQTKGDVTIANELDYELMQEYSLWIEARDRDSPPLSSFMKLSITITDKNDNVPRFSTKLYHTDVTERQPEGVSVLTVSATDADAGTNGEFAYYLEPDGNTGGAFAIDSTSGDIVTNISLDRETIAQYNLLVYAIDHGSPQLTGTTTVDVKVNDVNDNGPRFTSHPQGSVPEHSAVGTFVLQVTTKDDDAGANAVTVYELTNHANTFAIHNITGVVTVIADIDREQTDYFSVEVIATDLWKAYSVSTDIMISVVDVNDNDPEFVESEYTRELPEGLPSGSPVTVVSATDDDTGSNADVHYTMKTWSEYFAVDSVTGEVTLLQEIAYQWSGGDDSNTYRFAVLAVDGGLPTRWDEVNVSVIIFAANKYSPVFVHDSYHGRVQENANVGTSVVQVTAVDQDQGDNGVVKYEVTGGNGTDYFDVEADTGQVFVKSSLSGKAPNWYAVDVRAYDQGRLSRENFTMVTISVSSINNNAPSFGLTYYSASVYENKPLGSSVITVTASDTDSGVNGMIRYSISEGNANDDFIIGPQNGTITVANHLDYDTEPKSYTLIVLANDLGVISKSGSTTVDIQLLDVNDNSPVFDPSEYNPEIPENSPSGTSLVAVSATDADETTNAGITYSIIGGDGQYSFTILQNGSIYSQGHLNYEEKQTYDLTVKAENSYLDMHDYAFVTVHITGVNEYYPEFVKSSYTFTVSEAAEDGQIVGKISARDADHGGNGDVCYVLVGGSTQEGFAINEETGEIYVSYDRGRLNRESQESVLILAIAKNRGIVYGGDVDEAKIYVNITDANDAPVFVPSFYSGSVLEDATVGTYVLTVTAEDTDLDSADRTFAYNISGGNHNGAFSVHPTTGEIRTAAQLDREDIDFYNLTVAAVDEGSPPQTGYAEVHITLGDVNDNGPMFYPEDTLGSVYENEPTSTSVMTLSAYDPDTPDNGSPFTYYLLDSDDSDSFVLNRNTGLLTTQSSLDREQQSDYYLPVESRDSGIPQMTSTTTIHITILDRNDNPSSHRAATIYVNSFNNVFPGGSIGISHPLDPDVNDVFTCQIITASDDIFSMQPGCDLHSVQHTGVESYTLNISGHDGQHGVAYSDFAVDFHTYSNNSIDNSVTLILASETPSDSLDTETFLTDHYTAFYETVSDELTQGDMLLVLDMYEVGEELDLLVAIREPGDDNHMSRSDVATFFTDNKNTIENGANIVITKINYSPCEDQPCFNGGTCSDHVEVYDNHVSDSDPIIFVTRQSDRVFTCACRTPYYGQQCEQEPDSCESNPCKNGATCHKESLSYYCECPPGFTGSLCETDIDECASSPCQNGQCVDDVNGYSCTCNQGYTGTRCEFEIDPCVPQPCFNDGECIADQGTGFTCDCGFGERGDYCEFSSFSFDVLSYVQYPDISGIYSGITLQFATTLSNSLLLYNHDKNETAQNPEFIALEIIDGKVQFSYDLGDGTTRIKTDVIVSDGQWHQVFARRERSESTLIIDQCQDATPNYCFASSSGEGKNTQLDLDGVPLNIGGIKSVESIALHPGQLSTTDFVGCMRDLYINGNFYDLKQPLDIFGVTSRCPRDEEKCTSNPCQNGGTCIDEWWTYRCSCLEGFMGQHCEAEMTSFTFAEGSFVKYVIKDSFRRNQLLEGANKRKRRASDNTQKATLGIRTRQSNGLLLYVADSDDLYTILEVKDKKVMYSFKSGVAGSYSLTVEGVEVSDGQWHSVELVKNGHAVTVTVDGGNEVSENFDIPPHNFVSITVQDMFVGGTEQPLSHEGRQLNGLDGCIDSYKLNDVVMPFVGENEMVVAEPSDSGGEPGGCDGSDVCNPDPCPEGHYCRDDWEEYSCIPEGACESNPCQNNATCVPEENGAGYQCLCSGDFSGVHCEVPPACQEDPCQDNEECSADGSGGHVCSPIVGPDDGSSWVIPVVVTLCIILVVCVIVIVCIVMRRKKKKFQDHSNKPTDSAIVNLDSVGAVNEAYIGENGGKTHSPTNSEKVRLGIHGQQPDIIENEKKKINLDDDTVIIEGEDLVSNGVLFNDDIDMPEHYDLENASSIAPSDIDLTSHYMRYREGRQPRMFKPSGGHKHGSKSPNHLLVYHAQARQSPLSHLSRQSPSLFTPTSRQSPLSHGSRQSPIPMQGQMPHTRISPHIMSRTSPIKELSASRTNSEQSFNHSELRSEPGFRSNVSSASERSKRTKSPTGHLPNSRPSSRLKSPITVAVDADAEQPVGLSAEEVAMLNNKRTYEQVGSLPSTLDGLSSTSTDHPEERLSFPIAENLLEAPETSTDESNDSFTCSEYDFDREKLKFAEFDPRKMIFSKLAEVENEEEPNLGDSSLTYNYEGIDSAGGSLSTLQISEDEIPRVAVKPPNGHFSWDYLLNWGPSFQNLVGVFKDIALLDDANITMKLERDPIEEEYV